MANSLVPPQGGGGDVCARGFDTSVRRSRWSWPRPVITPPELSRRRSRRGGWQAKTRTKPYGDRRRPGQLGRTPTSSWSVTVGYVAARVPTLAGHRLTSDDDGVDGRTVRFLLKQSLAEKKKEWEEERRRLVQESVEQVRTRVDAENAARHAASSSTGKRRKRKKRKKKKLPRGFFCSLARRRQRQWYVCKAGFPGDVTLRAVLPSVVVRPEMLGIMASMNQKDNTTLVDYLGSLVLLVTMHLALCFLLVSPSPGCSASWPVWTTRIIAVACTRLVFMVNMLLALCSLPWSAGPGCSSSWPLWTRRTVASRSTCFRIQRNAWTSCYMLCVSLRMRLGRISHIFSMKVDPRRLHRCTSWTRLCHLQSRRHPCLYADADPHGPDVQNTKEIPHCIDTVADFPVVRVMLVLRCLCGEDIVLPQLQLAENIVASSLSRCRCRFPWSRLLV